MKIVKVLACVLWATIIFVSSSEIADAAYVWTGGASGGDFFNEANWGDEDTGTPPPNNSINPAPSSPDPSSSSINFDLLLADAILPSPATGAIEMGDGFKLTLDNASLTLTNPGGGLRGPGDFILNNGTVLESQYVSLGATAYIDGTSRLELRGSNEPMPTGGTVNLDPGGVLEFINGLDGKTTYGHAQIFNTSTGNSLAAAPGDFLITGNFSSSTTIQALAAVPEPSTWALGLLAGGTVALLMRRRVRWAY